ncbi:MAG: hypothetical protein L0Y77_11800, partial [Chlorobi bacterium]|nr:hypothetical protein [Chlorobiota bacterium]
KVQGLWLEEIDNKLGKLNETVEYMNERYNNLGEDVSQRIQSEEYLELVRKAFRAWDNADTDEKRRLVANLLTNAAGLTICSDDTIRIFIDWLNGYHEVHFAIIKVIHQNGAATKYEIWQEIAAGQEVRENSAEADLYKKLIRDLSTGGVIRQVRETSEDGRFLKKRTVVRVKSTFMESAFEDSKPIMLTELGKQFVHYTMGDIVPRVGEAEHQT